MGDKAEFLRVQSEAKKAGRGKIPSIPLKRKALSIPTGKKKKYTRSQVKVTVWEERDRLHIGIVDKATEEVSIADWWDDDARQMFEDGFFKPGIIHRSLDQVADDKMTKSVLDYAEEIGMLAK